MDDFGTGFVIVVSHAVLWGILIEWLVFRIRESRREDDD